MYAAVHWSTLKGIPFPGWEQIPSGSKHVLRRVFTYTSAHMNWFERTFERALSLTVGSKGRFIVPLAGQIKLCWKYLGTSGNNIFTIITGLGKLVYYPWGPCRGSPMSNVKFKKQPCRMSLNHPRRMLPLRYSCFMSNLRNVLCPKVILSCR